MTVKPNRPPLPRMAAWSAGLGVGMSILMVALIAWGMSDVDGDGEASFQEVADGTRPMKGDSDGDGAADGWEKAQGFDPLQGDDFSSFQGTPQPPDVLCDIDAPTQAPSDPLLPDPLGDSETPTPDEECEEPSPEAPTEQEAPQAPTVSDNTARMRTGMLALGAAAVAAIGAAFTTRQLL